MKALKAFIKPYEAPQSVKKKFDVIFSLLPGLGREGLIIEAKFVFPQAEWFLRFGVNFLSLSQKKKMFKHFHDLIDLIAFQIARNKVFPQSF